MPTLGRPVSEGGMGFDYRLAMGAPDLCARPCCLTALRKGPLARAVAAPAAADRTRDSDSPWCAVNETLTGRSGLGTKADDQCSNSP